MEMILRGFTALVHLLGFLVMNISEKGGAHLIVWVWGT